MMDKLPDLLDVDSTPLKIGNQIVAGDLNYDVVTIVSPKATIICSVRPTRATQQAKMEAQQAGKKK
ncbi:MAG: 50S ribosomal protein L25, partial [Bacteroidales bacterium]|nr:50S ribosomal protein L25 [Bacteroidales bacterium]